MLDGTGNPWYRADIGITGDRIRAMGSLGNATAKTVIDAADRYVTPGFIDVHSHAGGGLATEELKHGQPLLAQGLTTVFVNPDGGGPIDLAAQRATYEKQHIGTNVGQFVPHGSIRREVMAMSDRDPNAGELARMVELSRKGMIDGGVGLSSGLYYAPGSYSKTARGDRDGEGHRAVRRRLFEPHPRRIRLHHRRRRRGAGSDRHRGAGRRDRRRLAHEGARARRAGASRRR